MPTRFPMPTPLPVSPPACHGACLRTRRAKPPPPTRAGRAPAGGVVTLRGCHAPCEEKATAHASPYADAVCRRIALRVLANVVGRRHLYLPPPLLVCPVPCADVHGTGFAPGDACPLRGFAERTARTPTVPGARTRRRSVLRIRRRPPRRRPPLSFGDCGTCHTSTGPQCRLHERLALHRHPGGRAAAAESATPSPS